MVDDSKSKSIVKKSTTIHLGDDIYRMVSKTRGYCLLLDNYAFDFLPNRYECQIQPKLLKQVFTQLNFQVDHHQNLSYKDIVQLLDTYAIKDELVKHEALIIAIHSHAIENLICGTDFEVQKEKIHGVFTVQQIVEKFSDKNCPYLKGKPKIFIFCTNKTG
jgi:hypothetical protein